MHFKLSYLYSLVILLFLTTLCLQVAQTAKPKLHVGIAAALQTQPSSIGWAYSGGAVPLAFQYLQAHGYLTNFDFEFHVEYTECDLAKTISAGLEFMKNLDYDLIIGPPCAQALKVMGTLANIYKKPVLGWGFVSESELSDASRFPYVASVLPNSETLGVAAVKFLELFSWDRIALIYYKNELNHCNSVINDIESRLNDDNGYQVKVVMKEEVDIKSNESTLVTMQSIKSRARIVMFCGQTAGEKRDYIIKIAQLGMNTSEYVHIMVSMRSVGYGVQSSLGKTPFTQSGLAPLWESFSTNPDGLEETAKSGASKMLVLDLSSEVLDKEYLLYLTKNIVYAVKAPPLSCQAAECLAANATGMGAYARHLFDIILIYGMAVTKLNSTDPNVYRDIEKLIPNFVTTINGMTGLVQLNEELSRMPLYQVYGLNEHFDQISMLNISLMNGTSTISLNYKDENSQMWFHWGGSKPLDIPTCGFLGKSCPLTLYQRYGILIFVAVVVAVLTLLAFIICVIANVKRRRAEQERIHSEWQIPMIKLRLPEKKRSRKSITSIESDTSDATLGSEFNDHYTVQYYENEVVMTTNHASRDLTNQEMEQIAKLRKLDHENLHKFFGMSIDGSQFIGVWKLCSRGSLQDIICKGNFSMDYFFMFCMIRDIAEGINYIHQSFLKVHGNLRSANCLVDDSWQVKLADYGVDFLESEEKYGKRRLLWAAPEVLRGNLNPKTMNSSADIYSFAIIASEILTKKAAWNLMDRKEGLEEVIYLVKKEGSEVLRPDLYSDVGVNQTLLALVKDCWSEKPEDRPLSSEICKTIFKLTPNNKNNLMDHVFKMLEDYTSTLEIEVADRTKELSIEKKKSDILLSRMLPRQVAEKLKTGQAVEPEGFDMVTVFFSDLVKFTELATKCSPFQTVNLLNDLFSNFDAIIEKHDVYKVESIGDGFLCVSGLPMRNGMAHIKNIIDMALQFMEFTSTFKIQHLPREIVQLRIGVNSGPCVAGVVGLSMPRYCLFGDTVNTASRMESNGKPSMIHLSEAAHQLLTTYYPHQYHTNSRGEVIIKGKGVMETFWVLGKSSTTPPAVEEGSWKPRSSDLDEQTIRSVSPYMENGYSDNEDEMRKEFRELMNKL